MADVLKTILIALVALLGAVTADGMRRSGPWVQGFAFGAGLVMLVWVLSGTA